jgi:hypothetical protein
LLLAAPLPYTDPALGAGWAALLAYPRVYGAWLLWGWLVRALWKERHMAVHASPADTTPAAARSPAAASAAEPPPVAASAADSSSDAAPAHVPAPGR